MAILSTPLGWVMWLIYQLIPNFMIALLIFTVITRGIMFPFSIKQQKNMAKMAMFRPKIEKINKMYANNKQKQQEETMKLYEEEGYNPMSGCLPSLVPMIIMFGLIDVIYKPLTHIAHLSNDMINQLATLGGVEAKSSSFQLDIINAVINNRSAFHSIDAGILDKVAGLDLNFWGINLGDRPTWTSLLVLIPILSGLTSLMVSLYSMHKSQQVQGQQAGSGMMKGMMIVMPLMSIWFTFSFPAGVGIYWIFSNLLSGLQTFILYKVWTPERVAAQLEADKAAGKIKKKKPSKFQEAMKAAQAQQNGAAAPKPKAQPAVAAELEGLSQKEINRRRLAAARKRDAEKYGEDYVEVTDEDLK